MAKTKKTEGNFITNSLKKELKTIVNDIVNSNKKLTVNDIETITIKVVDEPNAGPAGASEVFESGTRDGCLDANALNYNSKALIDDGSCEYPKDPFKGNTQDIKDFQKKHGLTPDGKWGKKSQAKYDEVEESKKQKEDNKPEIKIEVEPSSESTNPYDNE